MSDAADLCVAVYEVDVLDVVGERVEVVVDSDVAPE